MGKLKELIVEYMKAPPNSPAEAEIASEIARISEWMMAQGYSDKPVTLPDKKYKFGRCKYRSSREPPCESLRMDSNKYGFCEFHFNTMCNWTPGVNPDKWIKKKPLITNELEV
jgi:hypothetical protein